MNCRTLRILSVMTLGLFVAAVAQVRADDPATPKKSSRVETLAVVVQATGAYWIGVHAVPVEAALKSHLGIDEDRLIVQQVIDKGPAKKAGVHQHDILLEFGDASIGTVEDLVKAVEKSQGNRTSLGLIRGGKKMTLKVTAEKRPHDHLHAAQIDLGNVEGLIRGWIQSRETNQEGGPFRFQIVGPGVVERPIDVTQLNKIELSTSLPKNLSLQITKTGDTPAKVKVTRDGETWEVTSKNLEALPDDVRPHVEKALRGQQGVAIGITSDGKHLRLKTLQVNPGNLKTHAIEPQVRQPGVRVTPGPASRVRRATEVQSGEVKQLRKDVEALKAAIKSLQEGKPKKNRKAEKDD